MNFLDLVKNGRHQAIMNYVKTCKCLGTDEEVALIKRGNHKEIMAYITEHYFEPDSLEVFIKRGKLNEIRYYLSCFHVIYDDCWEQILAYGSSVTNEIIDYILHSRWQFKKNSPTGEIFDEEEFLKEWDKVMCLIIQSGDHCAIRRLITQTKLGTRSQNCLSENGNAEDNLVYELKWGKLHRKH